MLRGDVNFTAVLTALENARYHGPFTEEMIPFSRLSNLTLPDLALARARAAKLKKILDRG